MGGRGVQGAAAHLGVALTRLMLRLPCVAAFLRRRGQLSVSALLNIMTLLLSCTPTAAAAPAIGAAQRTAARSSVSRPQEVLSGAILLARAWKMSVRPVAGSGCAQSAVKVGWKVPSEGWESV